jgi:hypothetical protein
LNDNNDVEPSNLASSGIALVLGFIVAGACFYVLGWGNPVFYLVVIVVLITTADWLSKVRRWINADPETRPPMGFPKRTLWTIFWVLFFGGLFVVWLDRELSNFHWR